MKSSFSSSRRSSNYSGSQAREDENYDLKGLNMIAPDQVMPKGETPFTINSRRYASNEGETSVAIRTRQGSTVLSTPVGETADVANAGAITSDINLTPGLFVAVPFTPTATGALTKFALHAKKSLNTRGYLIVSIHSDTIGLPGAQLTTTSIAPSLITDTYADVNALLMDAPDVTASTQYWAIVSMQELGSGTYSLAGTAGTGIYTSSDNMATWTAGTGMARFSSYVSTAGLIKGFTKRYPQDKLTNRTMFALGTDIYTLPDSPAVPALLSSTVSASATKVRFANIDDKTIWVTGKDPARWWDGTTVSLVAGAPTTPTHVFPYKERLLFVPSDEPNKVIYSDLYAYETWLPENFFYTGRPKSPDYITAGHEFNQAFTLFTRETKYTLTGTNVTSFDPNPHVGTKGAISQEATAVGKGVIYFMSDDKNIYAWDGMNDKLLSFKVAPELKKILDIDKVRLHFYNNQLRVYYNKNPEPTVTRMLMLDLNEGQWFMDTGRAVMGSMEWTQDDNEFVEFSSRCGWLFYGERGYSDLGKPIDFKYWTAYQSYGSGSAKDRIKRFRPVVRPAESAYYLSVGKDVDFTNKPNMRPWLVDSSGAKWGSFNWGDGTTYGSSKIVDNRAAMSGRGKFTQYRFEHEGIEQPVDLFGYIALVKTGRPK